MQWRGNSNSEATMSRQPDEFSQYHNAIRELIEGQAEEISALRQAVEKNKNGIWKMIATGAIGIIVTGASFWLMFAKDAATVDDVRQIIEEKVSTITARAAEDRVEIRDLKFKVDDHTKMIERLRARDDNRR